MEEENTVAMEEVEPHRGGETGGNYETWNNPT